MKARGVDAPRGEVLISLQLGEVKLTGTQTLEVTRAHGRHNQHPAQEGSGDAAIDTGGNNRVGCEEPSDLSQMDTLQRDGLKGKQDGMDDKRSDE